jgi:hypothetical protein
MCVCMYAYVHTYIRTHIHTHTHTCISRHVCVCTRMRNTHTHIHIRAYTRMKSASPVKKMIKKWSTNDPKNEMKWFQKKKHGMCTCMSKNVYMYVKKMVKKWSKNGPKMIKKSMACLHTPSKIFNMNIRTYMDVHVFLCVYTRSTGPWTGALLFSREARIPVYTQQNAHFQQTECIFTTSHVCMCALHTWLAHMDACLLHAHKAHDRMKICNKMWGAMAVLKEQEPRVFMYRRTKQRRYVRTHRSVCVRRACVHYCTRIAWLSAS